MDITHTPRWPQTRVAATYTPRSSLRASVRAQCSAAADRECERIYITYIYTVEQCASPCLGDRAEKRTNICTSQKGNKTSCSRTRAASSAAGIWKVKLRLRFRLHFLLELQSGAVSSSFFFVFFARAPPPSSCHHAFAGCQSVGLRRPDDCANNLPGSILAVRALRKDGAAPGNRRRRRWISKRTRFQISAWVAGILFPSFCSPWEKGLPLISL